MTGPIHKFRTVAAIIRATATLCFLFSLPASAQYDSLLHKPYGKNVTGIHAMYRDLINIQDSTIRAQTAEGVKSFARKHNDRRLELNVDFFLVFWNAFYQRQSKEKSLKSLKDLVDRSTKENVDFLRARSLRALAEFYWKIEKNYELAFEQYLLLDKEISTANPDDYPEMARDLMQIGKSYYFFHDYSVAIGYFKRAIALPENSFTTGVINDARNTLGLSYQQTGHLDSADYYFQQVTQTRFPEAFAWKRVAAGNIGTDFYLRNQYDKAIPLLEADFYGAEKENDLGAAAGAAIPLADIYRSRGDFKQSENLILKARKYIRKAQQPERLRLLYPVMSKWYADIGAIDSAKCYIDSSILASNRYHEEFSALKVLRAQQEIDRQKAALQLTTFNLEKAQKITERNMLILLAIIFCITAVLTYFIQKKRQISRDLILQKATQELEIAKINLGKFTDHILEKNKLIEELELRLEKNSNIFGQSLIHQLQQSTILTEDDWHQFKSLFEQVHAGFLFRLKEKYPNLSPAEIRFLSLAKLHFNNKEMAAALGVSTQSIRTNWYRIRKKLNLNEELTAEDLVANI